MTGMQNIREAISVVHPYGRNCEYLGDWTPEHKIDNLKSNLSIPVSPKPSDGSDGSVERL